MDRSTQPVISAGGPPMSFLDLPPEIRLDIYKYLLTVPPYSKLQTVRPSRRLHVSILRVNRRINREAVPILYSHNTFIAHPTLLTSFPSLRKWYPPVREPSVLSHIRRFHLRVRLDCDPQYDADAVAAAFTGIDELNIEIWEAMFGGAGHGALRVFECVRGVKRVMIWGSTSGIEDYVSWLEGVMRSDIGRTVPSFEPGPGLESSTPAKG